MNDQFTQRVSEIIMFSKEEANRIRNNFIGPEHIFLGLLRQGEGKAIGILFHFGIDLYKVKEFLENTLLQQADNSIEYNENINFNKNATAVFKSCIEIAQHMNDSLVDSEHLLLALMKSQNNVYSILVSLGLTYDGIIQELNKFNFSIDDGLGYNDDEDEDDYDDDNYSKSDQSYNNQAVCTQKKADSDTPILDSFGIDLTQAAINGTLDPVVGRKKEIERVAQILSRRKKNNPILIGEPGVGKSAIVEGLALRIVQKKVSRVLFNKRVVSLDLTGMVAGTKYRGQFEERVRGMLNELKKNSNIILFIDEIHTIVGAGSAAGSMDAANMLKPALARGEIQCVGATTIDEYRKSIEKDGALERRFQKIIVDQTTAEETIQILNNIKDKYEEHHNVYYTNEAIEACVKLTDRYISDRSFPDKAIDALDEAGSRVHLNNIIVPKEVEEVEQLIEDLRKSKNKAVEAQDFELAANYRDSEKEATIQLDKLKEKWEESLKEKREIVDKKQIEDVVSTISGIPIQKMAQDDGKRLVQMKSMLQSRVIGQDGAIETLTRAIQRNKIGIKDPNKPIGTFLFLGPTGVGKTYLAKELASFMFGSSDSLIRMDMSEYMEKFAASRLVGAPPGYVGYDEGGQLTEKVRRRPYSIVLLDEIEKAHADIFNILLQVMDEGRLTDSNGRTVDFKNTIIIMTSNVGSRQLKDFANVIGFSNSNTFSDVKHSREIINKALNKTFAPEFINRIDEIINFDQLNLDSLIKIIDIELKELIDRIKSIGYQFVIEQSAKEFLAKKGLNTQYGARPLKRAIQTYLEDKISETILSGDFVDGDVMKAVYNDKNGNIDIIKEDK